jgi:hypothetical protein
MKPRTQAAILFNFWIAVGTAVLLIAASLSAEPSPPRTPDSAPQQTQKLSASAIQFERTDPPEGLLIPEDTRIATYENVILQLTKTKKFQHVYRSGDRTAADVPDLVILRVIPQDFKKGSQKQREVTTVSGSTSIKVKIQFASRDGKILREKVVEGKVRFYGENLRATYDLAKKVAGFVNETF